MEKIRGTLTIDDQPEKKFSADTQKRLPSFAERMSRLHPRRWKAAVVHFEGVFYHVHPDKKVYQPGPKGGLRRVKDAALAKEVYDVFLRSQKRRPPPGDPTR